MRYAAQGGYFVILSVRRIRSHVRGGILRKLRMTEDGPLQTSHGVTMSQPVRVARGYQQNRAQRGGNAVQMMCRQGASLAQISVIGVEFHFSQRVVPPGLNSPSAKVEAFPTIRGSRAAAVGAPQSRLPPKPRPYWMYERLFVQLDSNLAAHQC